MQNKIVYAIVSIIAFAIIAIVAYATSINNGSPHLKLDIPLSVVSHALPGYNITNITSKSDVFSGVLKSEGYISATDQVFTGETNASKSIIIDVLLMMDSNSSVSNSTLNSELSQINASPTESGSHFGLINIKNYSDNGVKVQIYELLDIGLLNLTVVNRSVNAGLTLMPYYQFTSMFSYKNYYGSATVDAYSNSSLAASASMYLAEYLLNHTVNNTYSG
ncbi:MAG: hypothetical protein QXR85_02950 [Candidatus Micrarchaeaceae archaeon]